MGFDLTFGLVLVLALVAGIAAGAGALAWRGRPAALRRSEAPGVAAVRGIDHATSAKERRDAVARLQLRLTSEVAAADQFVSDPSVEHLLQPGRPDGEER